MGHRACPEAASHGGVADTPLPRGGRAAGCLPSSTVLPGPLTPITEPLLATRCWADTPCINAIPFGQRVFCPQPKPVGGQGRRALPTCPVWVVICPACGRWVWARVIRALLVKRGTHPWVPGVQDVVSAGCREPRANGQLESGDGGRPWGWSQQHPPQRMLGGDVHPEPGGWRSCGPRGREHPLPARPSPQGRPPPAASGA